MTRSTSRVDPGLTETYAHTRRNPADQTHQRLLTDCYASGGHRQICPWRGPIRLVVETYVATASADVLRLSPRRCKGREIWLCTGLASSGSGGRCDPRPALRCDTLSRVSFYSRFRPRAACAYLPYARVPFSGSLSIDNSSRDIATAPYHPSHCNVQLTPALAYTVSPSGFSAGLSLTAAREWRPRLHATAGPRGNAGLVRTQSGMARFCRVEYVGESARTGAS